MTKQKFKPGEVVVLRSGGPDMTIKAYEPKDSTDVTCIWFDPNGIQEKSFPQDLLDIRQEISIDDIYDALR